MEAQRRKSAVAWLSVISNTSLVAGKLVVGLFIGSVSVISEAIHSGVDLLAAVIALFAV
ncbi:MAG: cation transporter, partial [candidate division NC10 bacterium]